MIHFDFIVSDLEATNIFDCINTEITHCNTEIINCMASKMDKSDDIEWLRKHIEYLKGLKLKMTNTRVTDGIPKG